MDLFGYIYIEVNWGQVHYVKQALAEGWRSTTDMLEL